MFDAKLATRIFFGLIMAVILLGLLFAEAWLSAERLPVSLRGLVFGLIAGIVGSIALNELLAMMRDRRFIRVGWILFAGMFAGATGIFWVPDQFGVVFIAGLMAMILLVAALCQGVMLGPDATFRHLGFVSFVAIYLIVGFYFMVCIRRLGARADGWADQIAPIVMFLSIVKFADIGAYLTGRAIGRHKWVPSISPNKTWEGLAGGIVLGVVAAVVSAKLFSLMTLPFAVLSGLIIGVTGQLGDLLESMLKRDSQIKDSAKMVPEFGGILDLIDSPVAAAPVAYFLFVLIL